MTRISVVTAFLNEAQALPEFRRRVEAAIARWGDDFELVLVDDHSTDSSSALARGWAEQDPRVHYLRLARNCGPHAAFAAGLARVQGDCAVLLASDLQSPPEAIVPLVEAWQQGYDVVWGARAARETGESLVHRWGARVFYWLLRAMALPDAPTHGAELVLVDRRVIDAYNAIPEKHTNLGAMLLWIGFRQTSVPCLKQPRHAGRSRWNWPRRLKLVVDSLVSFSYAPIRLASLLGLSASFLGFLWAALVLVNLAAGKPVTGWSSTMTAVLLLGGFQLLVLGVLGEYIWRTFDEARGRPRYVVEEEWCRGSSTGTAARTRGRPPAAATATNPAKEPL